MPTNPQPAPFGENDLFASMQKRMASVQQGLPDPGNMDLYGYNQAVPGKAPNATTPPTPTTPTTPQEVPVQAPGLQPAAPGSPITTAQQAATTPATVGQTPAQGAPTTVAQSFQQALVNRMNPQAVTAQNPAIAPAIQANNLAEQRAFERNRNLLAERAAATGTNNSGGFETGLLGLAQDRAGREASFAGNQVADLARRQDEQVLSLLGLSGSLLGDQDRLGLAREQLTQQGGLDRERMSLTERMANLDAQIRREQLAQTGSLGGQDLALRGRLGEAGLNNQLLGLLLNDRQFGQSLGQNAAQFGASMDNNTLMALLGNL